MLRLTHTYRQRVSNRLAVLAAFLLVAASLATGIDHAMDNPANAANSMAASTATSMDRGQVREASVNKGFKVRLYLFRRN